MLTENQLRSLPIPIWDNFRRLESDLIARICERIQEIGKLTASDVNRIAELQRIGYDITAMEREIASTVNRSTSQVRDLFRAAAEAEYGSYDFISVPFADNDELQLLIQSISDATVSEMVNMSQTTAFVNARTSQGVRSASGVVQSLPEYYQSVVDYASLQIRTGQTDFNAAMRATIRALSDHGLSTVNYASGYRRRLDTAVRANLMDAQARLSAAQAELVGAQFGADGMEISFHSGPRPSHVWIGGKQFSMARYRRDVVPVLLDPNCYHRAFPILLNISAPTHTPEELAELNARDAELHEYGGKEFNAYDAQQEQRKFETAIRREKDRTKAFKASGDKDAAAVARARARAVQAEYARFSDAMSIPIKPARTGVAGFR